MEINFTHHQSAHCENGVISNLMKHHGFQISEPMAFGIGSGLLFCHIPFLMVNHAPTFTYIALSGIIFISTRLANRLKIIPGKAIYVKVGAWLTIKNGMWQKSKPEPIPKAMGSLI